jgi:mannose-1-phosphate guanylyltransferase/mannose-6-phosphate isomerase
VAFAAKIYPVLLSGGAGSRLWPLSRESNPKQFLPLTSERSLLQQTALRVLDPDLFEPLTVIGSAQHRFLIAQQLSEIGVQSPTIVLEPSARSTAAPAAIAALIVSQSNPDGLVLLAPADHRIEDIAAFRSAVRDASEAALSGHLSLFGIPPDQPATGYGYIRLGARLSANGRTHKVAAFVEKPDRATAEGYLKSGDHLWNSGIFLLPVRAFIAELERYEPKLLGHARNALERASRDDDFVRLEQEAFDRCRAISIDYAVMERTDRMAVLPVDFDWTDVGSWSTLADMADRDGGGNTTIGEVLTESTVNCYIRSEGPLVAAIGVENLVIVATPDAILVARKDQDQDVKRIVDRLRGGNHGRL